MLGVLTDVARGMEYMHAKRICHGDLNPSNVLFKARAHLSLVVLLVGTVACRHPRARFDLACKVQCVRKVDT
jgi:serine/threonine protein kinase